jgi:hypothetical protein
MNLREMKRRIWRYLNFNMDLPNALSGHQWDILGLDKPLTDHQHQRWDRAIDEVADEMWNKHRGN